MAHDEDSDNADSNGKPKKVKGQVDKKCSRIYITIQTLQRVAEMYTQLNLSSVAVLECY